MSQRLQITLDDGVIKALKKSELADKLHKKATQAIVAYLTEHGLLK